jgi:hypothetical protein
MRLKLDLLFNIRKVLILIQHLFFNSIQKTLKSRFSYLFRLIRKLKKPNFYYIWATIKILL